MRQWLILKIVYVRQIPRRGEVGHIWPTVYLYCSRYSNFANCSCLNSGGQSSNFAKKVSLCVLPISIYNLAAFAVILVDFSSKVSDQKSQQCQKEIWKQKKYSELSAPFSLENIQLGKRCMGYRIAISDE